jgi:Wiskott-Aldrich syndrome protein
MDVDGESLTKYDEYVPGTTREVITIETKIKSTNKGFAMLSKLGWSEGQPLGLSGDGTSQLFLANYQG